MLLTSGPSADPVLLRVGDWFLGVHGAFMVAGALVALVTTWRSARRTRRADSDFLLIMTGGVVAAALFARFGLIVRYLHFARDPSVDGFLQYGGKTLLGGLTGAYIGVLLTKKLIGYRRHTGDLFAAGVAVGIAIGRIGCFLTETPGTPTSLPWGVRRSAAQDGAAMHPSFLYESIFLALLSWWLFRVERSGRPIAPWMKEGDVFKVFLFAYAVFRLGVEFVRGNPVMALGLSGSQLMVLSASMVLAIHFARRWKSSRDGPGTSTHVIEAPL